MRSYIADQRRQAMCLFVKGRAGQRASKDPPQMNTASAPPALCTEWQVIESSMETRGIMDWLKVMVNRANPSGADRRNVSAT